MKRVSVRQKRNLFPLILGFVVMALLIGWIGPFQAKAILITSDSGLPPIEGEYTTYDSDVFAVYEFSELEIILEHVCLGDFTNVLRTPYFSIHESESFGATLSGSGLALKKADGSSTSDPVQLTGSVEFITYNKFDQPTGSFQMEVISMNLSGELLTPYGTLTILMRESPFTISSGRTIITDNGGGEFWIDSFFDVFTELSLDGGDTWVESRGSTLMELNPAPVTEPATMLLLGFGILGLAGFRRKFEN